MPVRFSTRAPNSDYLGFEASPEAIITAAKKAEEVGFDAILVNDHIIVGNDARSAPWTNVYDPFVAMSFIAAHTTRIGVGVSVMIMPYRNPIATAKALATLDRMSGGRLVAGIGAGWNEAEFAALGVPFRERGARTNEYLRYGRCAGRRARCRLPANLSRLLTCMSAPNRCSSRIRRSGWRGERRGAATRGAVRGRVAADTAAPSGAGRAPRGIASGVRGTRARADPDADELSGRVQHHHRERAAGRQGAVNRARYARRGCCRPDALPRSGRCRGFPDQFPWQP